MEFEDWDSFMEPQYFFYNGESSFDVGEPRFSSRGASPQSSASPSSSSFVGDLAMAVLSSVAKAAIPAAAFFLYQYYYESACPCDYKGSCHCESVHLELQATRRLKIQTNRAKSRYNDVMHRFIKVKIHQFEIIKGEDHLKTFQVDGSSSDALATGGQGARAFCRRCGVHILQAPSQDSKYLMINVTCLADPAKSSNGVLPKSVMDMAMETLDTITNLVSQTALSMIRLKRRDLIQEEEEVSEVEDKPNPNVQSLLGVGNVIYQVLRPYVLSLLGSANVYQKKEGGRTDSENDLTHTTKPSTTHSLSDMDDLSSVSSKSRPKQPKSRLELFHAASTPKQTNVPGNYGKQLHHSTPSSLPQQ